VSLGSFKDLRFNLLLLLLLLLLPLLLLLLKYRLLSFQSRKKVGYGFFIFRACLRSSTVTVQCLFPFKYSHSPMSVSIQVQPVLPKHRVCISFFFSLSVSVEIIAANCTFFCGIINSGAFFYNTLGDTNFMTDTFGNILGKYVLGSSLARYTVYSAEKISHTQ
jgi:hypothetical protein